MAELGNAPDGAINKPPFEMGVGDLNGYYRIKISTRLLKQSGETKVQLVSMG